MQHLFAFVLALLLLATPNARGTNIVLCNDDGWAEINIRTLYDTLTNAGDSVVVSAPSQERSGSGGNDQDPTPLTKPCEFNSCPSGSPAEGHDASNPRLNYVNSYPVTAMRYGIRNLSPKIFGSYPDIALSGFNVGRNAGFTVLVSGTIAAASEAVRLGIPSIAFAGVTGSPTAHYAKVETYMRVYAELSTIVTHALVASGKPYLPDGVWLNVNFSPVSEDRCTSASDFKFVLSRIFPAIPGLTPHDVKICGRRRLPTERKVMRAHGCHVSISAGNASIRLDAYEAQSVVLQKLKDILVCLPH